MNDDIISIGDMHVRVAGHGPALVFCHGFTTTGEFWRQQMGAFSHDHQLVVPDLPGHGRSASPRSRRYTIDAFVNDLVLLFDKLRLDDAILVGLSWAARSPSVSRSRTRVACARWCWWAPPRTGSARM